MVRDAPLAVTDAKQGMVRATKENFRRIAMSPDDVVVEEVSQALLYAAATSIVTLERADGVLWFQDAAEEEGVFAVTETSATLRLGKELQSSLHKVGDPYENMEDTVDSVRDLVGRLYRQGVVLH